MAHKPGILAPVVFVTLAIVGCSSTQHHDTTCGVTTDAGTCNSCITHSCCSQASACAGNADCSALLDCVRASCSDAISIIDCATQYCNVYYQSSFDKLYEPLAQCIGNTCPFDCSLADVPR